jgi:hypothetical protein
MFNEPNVKNIVLYCQAPPESSYVYNTQTVNEINNIRDVCRQCNWRISNIFIDKEKSGAMYKSMRNFVADPKNKITGVIYLSAGNSLIEFGDNPDSPTAEAPAEKAETGKFTGGVVPYGYALDSAGALVLDEEKAAVVLEIYNSRAENQSLRSIADALNKRGVASYRGGMWSKAAIAYILKNPVYTGKYNKNGVTNKIPRIITTTLYNKINAQ